MASSGISAGEVLDILLEDNLDLSEEDISEDDDEDCIYGYLGRRIFRHPRSTVDFPSKDEVAATSEGLIVEESFLEDRFEDMDDGSHPIDDIPIPPSSISGETSEHASLEAKPEVVSHSEVVSSRGETVSTCSTCIETFNYTSVLAKRLVHT